MASLGLRTRFRILNRDGFRCRYCGAAADWAGLEVDHVVARSAGGSDDDSNLATACFPCNRGKRTDAIRPRTLRRLTQEAEFLAAFPHLSYPPVIVDGYRAGLEALARILAPKPREGADARP